VEGVLGAFSVAAEAFGMERSELLGRGTQFIHGTTHAINAIVTGRVARTALLVSDGHPDILLLREGGREKPFDHTVRYQRAFIPRSRMFEVPGRFTAQGAELRPLDEAAVIRIAEQLREDNIEAIAVSLLWSILDPRHELRVEEILNERLPGVPVTLSHRLNPSLREYRRTIADRRRGGDFVRRCAQGKHPALRARLSFGDTLLRAPEGTREIVLAIILLAILIFRPQGLVGEREAGERK
jgi:N-methylhydantoinase A